MTRRCLQFSLPGKFPSLYPQGGSTMRGYVSDPEALRVAFDLGLIKLGDRLHVVGTYNFVHPKKSFTGVVVYEDPDNGKHGGPGPTSDGQPRVRYMIRSRHITDGEDWVRNDYILGWKANS